MDSDFPETVGNGIITPTDFHSIIFQRGRYTTNQLPIFDQLIFFVHPDDGNFWTKILAPGISTWLPWLPSKSPGDDTCRDRTPSEFCPGERPFRCPAERGIRLRAAVGSVAPQGKVPGHLEKCCERLDFIMKNGDLKAGWWLGT